MLLTIFRLLTAVIAPIGALLLALITLRQVNQDEGEQPFEGQQCLRCKQTRKGAEGQFNYTDTLGSTRKQVGKQALISADMPILGSETHFICDQCARRFVRNEIIQIVLMALAYPLYLFAFIPLFSSNGLFTNFLLESLLVVFSFAGLTAAYDLFRYVHASKTALVEARDRVAINERKNTLGKRYSYYTQSGSTAFRK